MKQKIEAAIKGTLVVENKQSIWRAVEKILRIVEQEQALRQSNVSGQLFSDEERVHQHQLPKADQNDGYYEGDDDYEGDDFSTTKTGMEGITHKMQNTRQKIASILIDKMDERQEELTDNTNFHSDLGMDSLDTVEVLMEMEREFNINIAYNEAGRIKTFGQLVQLVNDHVSDATWQNK